MEIRILTYNLLNSVALKGVGEIFTNYKPDIVLFQEIHTSPEVLTEVEKHGYVLADYSNSFFKFNKIYGVATFYNSEKLTFNNSHTIRLSTSIIEMIRFMLRGGRSNRTVLKTEFTLKGSDKQIRVYNIHLTPFSTNSVRERQMRETFDAFELETLPTVIAGDFNFIYNRRYFESVMNKSNLKEATDKIFYTYKDRWLGIIPVKGKIDYVLYQKIKHTETFRIEVEYSDHYPLLARFEV